MRRPHLWWLLVLLAICLSAEAHQVNLVTAPVALTPDRTVGVELGLKGSDVDRLIGTKLYDARQDAVDPPRSKRTGPQILAYFDRLAPNAVAPSLVDFNIGIEIGQVAIVAVALPILRLVDRLSAKDQSEPVRAVGLVYTLSAVIGLLGGHWLLARILEA